MYWTEYIFCEIARADRAGQREVEAALDDLLAKRTVPRTEPGTRPRLSNPRKALEDELRAQGSDMEHVRAELWQRIALGKLAEHRGGMEPAESELAAAHAADPTRWGKPRRATVEGFLARAVPGAPAHARQQALEATRAFAADVTTGTPETLAKAHGLTHVAAFQVTSTGVEPQLAAVAFGLTVGQWSQPVQTRAGWIVLRLVKIEEGEERPLVEVREQVRLYLLNQHRLVAQRQVLAELRAKATIAYLQW